MGQSGPKINPVWAGGTVAKHGTLTAAAELWVTVHRTLFIPKMGRPIQWYCSWAPDRLKYQGQGRVVSFG